MSLSYVKKWGPPLVSFSLDFLAQPTRGRTIPPPSGAAGATGAAGAAGAASTTGAAGSADGG